MNGPPAERMKRVTKPPPVNTTPEVPISLDRLIGWAERGHYGASYVLALTASLLGYTGKQVDDAKDWATVGGMIRSQLSAKGIPDAAAR